MRLNFTKNREIPIALFRAWICGAAEAAPEEFLRANPGMVPGLLKAPGMLTPGKISRSEWQRFLQNFFISTLTGPHRELAEIFMPLTAERSAESSCTAGEHVLTSLLGIGSSGCVYKTRDGRCLKISGPANKSRLEEEYRCLKELHHPHIVKTYRFFSCREFAAMEMELLSPGTGPEKEYIEALEYCHGKEILHGDIRLKNLGVDSEGRSCIFDFGSVRTAGSREEKESEIRMLKSVLRSPAACGWGRKIFREVSSCR
ncbi:MAG: protein kinase family protein [Lentisphaeria bacterium]|nr:protein kinase family protein [Lentisphaeria bacterium]